MTPNTAAVRPTRLVTLKRIVRSILLAPIWAGQLLTGAKSFADNPIIGSPALNRMGLHAARLSLAHRLSAMRRARIASLLSPEDRQAFERDGFVMKPSFLPDAEFAALTAEIRAFRGPGRETVQGDAITRRIALDPRNLDLLPQLKRIIQSSDLQRLMRYAGSFDAEPMLYVQSILTGARDAPPDPQLNLHSDAFHPTVKAWLFLTDVTEDGAPFRYVPGSHRLTPERLAWEREKSIVASRSPDRLTRRGSFRIDHEELPDLGLPQPRAFAVPANTLIVADTFGFHARGPSAGGTLRVELWAYGRHNPFTPWARLMLWNIPALARRRADLFWRFGDLLEALGISRNVWHKCPNISAFDPAKRPDQE
jgi:hypothetical protein